MTATALDLSAIRTDATTYAGTFRTLIGVYSSAQVDALIAGLTALEAEDIDTLAEINAILTDANLASIAYVDGLAANYATAAQGALSDTALQPSDITSGTITAGTSDIDFDSLGGGGAESPLTLTASAATETPLTVQGAASQTANLQEWQNSAETVVAAITSSGRVVTTIVSADTSATSSLLEVVNGLGKKWELRGGQQSQYITCGNTFSGGAGYIFFGAGSPSSNPNSGSHAFSADTANQIIYLGPVTVAAPADRTLASTGGLGSNIAGAALKLAGGKGTGTGAGGPVKIQTAPAGSSGSTLNALLDAAEFDTDATAGNTRMLVWDVDTGTLVRVSVGSADSGGTGFKVLRIPN